MSIPYCSCAIEFSQDLPDKFCVVCNKPTYEEAKRLEKQHLPKCYIVDLDGTTAINDGHRHFFNWKKVGGDKPNIPVIEVITTASHFYGRDVLYVSGRDEVCRFETQDWLDRMCLPSGPLFMRPKKDMRDDTIVKREIYDREIKDKYEVVAVFDDRNKVVKMWRELGLTVLQVAEGDF